MDNLGQVTLKTISLFGRTFQVDPVMFIMTWIVMGLLVLIGIITTRRLKTIPGKGQNIVELTFEFIRDITVSTLGDKDGRRFLPFILTLFLFTLIANWIGLLPNFARILGMFIALGHKAIGAEAVQITVESWNQINLVPDTSAWYGFLFKVPNFMEPTRSVNTDLAMGLMVFLVVHINSMIKKGPLKYLQQYWGEVIPCRGWWLLLAPINVMIPLNLIGEVSSVVSHSFRLFGNIFGGFMIVVIVSSLVKFLIVPVGLYIFFGLFAGLVQAFVFAMLAVTYISQKN